MRLLKLKKEARQFFKKELHEAVKCIGFWSNLRVHENLLDEVDKVFIMYGEQKGSVTFGIGWSRNEHNEIESPTTKIPFEIHVLNSDYKEYEKINIAEIMDLMQSELNKYFDK